MLHYARQQGLKSLAGHVVPVAQVSMEKGKQAVALHLALQSLAESLFSAEKWTMRETSYEMWVTEPKHCFKRGGRTMRVCYDGSEDNRVLYTAWNTVYYAKTDGGWAKVPGGVDCYGAYYTWEGEPVYYVDLRKEWAKYGTTGTWAVHCGGKTYTHSASITSGPLPIPELAEHTATPAAPSTSACSAAQAPQRRRPGNWGDHPSAKRRRLQAQPVERPGQRPADNSQQRQQECAHPSVPVILLSGEANQLKCLRHRIKTNHRTRFASISTTWTWAVGGTGGHHVLITFQSDAQRVEFQDRVSVPAGVRVSLGPLPT